MYMIVGYNLMYPVDGNGFMPAVSFFLGGDNEAADVIASGGEVYYSALSDFFFQVVFVATAMSIVSGAVAERMKIIFFLVILYSNDRSNISNSRLLEMGRWFSRCCWFSRFCWFWCRAFVWCCSCSAGCLLGARKGKYENGKINAVPGSNMPLATLGTFILWLGWFGFNGGSELMVSNVGEANAVAMVLLIQMQQQPVVLLER